MVEPNDMYLNDDSKNPNSIPPNNKSGKTLAEEVMLESLMNTYPSTAVPPSELTVQINEAAVLAYYFLK